MPAPRASPGSILWTLAGLPAAERLYAEAGFALEEEVTGQQWGRPVTERRLGLSL